MRLLIREGEDLIEARDFESPTITIGSDQACDVRLPDRRLLPQQLFILRQDDGTWLAQAADGGVPIILNGRPMIRPTVLHHADELRLDIYSMVVSRGANDHEPPTPAAVPSEVAKLRAHPLPAGSQTKSSRDTVALNLEHLTDLARFGVGLGDCGTIPLLMDHALDVLLAEFRGRVAYVGVRQKDIGAFEFVQGRTRDGRNADEPRGFNTYTYRCLERGQYLLIPKADAPEIGSAMVVPLSCARGILGMAYVDRKSDENRFDESDFDRLTNIAALVAAQAERLVVRQLDVQNASAAGQLALLQEIQARMDPATVPQWEGLQLAAYCKPGRQRIRDIYDIMRLPNGLATIMIASIDAADPLRRALAMAEMRCAFRAAGLHMDAPHTFLRSANWMLNEDRTSCQMHAVVIAMNPVTGEVQYSSAGRIGAIVVDGRGDSRDLAEHTTPSVGSVANYAYESGFDQIAQGETLAFFTEGTWTVENAQGTPLGIDPVIDSIRDGFGQAASVALDDLVQDHASYFKQGKQPDDITIMLFHRVALPA